MRSRKALKQVRNESMMILKLLIHKALVQNTSHEYVAAETLEEDKVDSALTELNDVIDAYLKQTAEKEDTEQNEVTIKTHRSATVTLKTIKKGKKKQSDVTFASSPVRVTSSPGAQYESHDVDTRAFITQPDDVTDEN